MPLTSSNFKAKGLFKNPHYSTIYSAKLRISPVVNYTRKRVFTPDGDFVDVDWLINKPNNCKVAILLHGLEGNSNRSYITAAADLLHRNGWDCAALNFRGCSGQTNDLFKSYHSGATEDLRFLINLLIAQDQYKEITLYGVSLGGNVLLKYLGEEGHQVSTKIKAGVAVGVPIDLHASLAQLMKFENWVYRNSFLKDLRKKYRLKISKFPDQASYKVLKKIKTLQLFDEYYTAPAHGFANANSYYTQASSLNVLPQIITPVLLLNAKNDTFLKTDCYPVALAQQSKNIFLEIPDHGGHVGFYNSGAYYYSEKRTLNFFNEIIG